jgi:hypothetical protein
LGLLPTIADKKCVANKIPETQERCCLSSE